LGLGEWSVKHGEVARLCPVLLVVELPKLAPTSAFDEGLIGRGVGGWL